MRGAPPRATAEHGHALDELSGSGGTEDVGERLRSLDDALDAVSDAISCHGRADSPVGVEHTETEPTNDMAAPSEDRIVQPLHPAAHHESPLLQVVWQLACFEP